MATVIPEGELLRSVYTDEYIRAYSFFEEGVWEQCIEAAKYNLRNATLPLVHQMKNHILIGCAEDDWDAGEVCRQPILLTMHSLLTRIASPPCG